MFGTSRTRASGRRPRTQTPTDLKTSRLSLRSCSLWQRFIFSQIWFQNRRAKFRRSFRESGLQLIRTVVARGEDVEHLRAEWEKCSWRMLGSAGISWNHLESGGISWNQEKSGGINKNLLEVDEINWNKEESAEISRNQEESTWISWNQQGSGEISRDQLESGGINRNQQKSGGISWDQQESGGINRNQMESRGISWEKHYSSIHPADVCPVSVFRASRWDLYI